MPSCDPDEAALVQTKKKNVSLPYIIAGLTQDLYKAPFIRFDIPFVHNTAETSLNLFHAAQIRTDTAASDPPPFDSMSPR